MFIVGGLKNFSCLLGGAALLTGGPHMLPTSTWKEGHKEEATGCPRLVKVWGRETWRLTLVRSDSGCCMSM